MEQWSSASLPLTGGCLCLLSCVFTSPPRTRSKTATFDCHLFDFRGAMLGAHQGDWSRRHSSRFTARVGSGSAKSSADDSAVWKELRRRRDLVRNEKHGGFIEGRCGWFVFLQLIAPYLCCSLSVVVEDVSSSCCVTVKVFPYMTVAALKQQVRKIVN